MAIITESILIAAPAEGLFELSQDYTLRQAWDPFVGEMRFRAGATEAAQGVCVWVRAWNGLTMEVQFTGFLPPHSVAMKMLRGPWFFQAFAGTWLFKPHENGQTEVTFRYAFQTRPLWLRWLLNPLVRWLLGRDVRARLAGLKRGAEEGHLLEQLKRCCGSPS